MNRSCEKEIINQLLAVVARLGLAGVVVADRRVNRNPVDEVAVRLIKSKKPVVIFIAGRAQGDAEQSPSSINVIAGRKQQPNAPHVNRFIQRRRDLALAAVGPRSPAHADAKISNDRERERRVLIRVRVSAEAVIVTATA